MEQFLKNSSTTKGSPKERLELTNQYGYKCNHQWEYQVINYLAFSQYDQNSLIIFGISNWKRTGLF